MPSRLEAPPRHALPTEQAYAEYVFAFDHFNCALFDSALPPALITFQRVRNSLGFLAPDRFLNRVDGAKTAELALNPVYFAVATPQETLQVLVHEMVHLWQRHFGEAGRRGYHNREWADRMEAVGLMPSSTGRPGGKRTGERVAEYVVPGGRFEQACGELLQVPGFRLSWLDRFAAKAFPTDKALDRVVDEGTDPEVRDDAEALTEADLQQLDLATATRSAARYQRKYRCEAHDLNVWGKRGLKVVCGLCMQPLEES